MLKENIIKALSSVLCVVLLPFVSVLFLLSVVVRRGILLPLRFLGSYRVKEQQNA